MKTAVFNTENDMKTHSITAPYWLTPGNQNTQGQAIAAELNKAVMDRGISGDRAAVQDVLDQISKDDQEHYQITITEAEFDE